MSTSEHPPTPPSFINDIELDAVADSKIASVSVYLGRAEVTRVFKLSIKTGQNLVKLNGLPNVLETDSVRVEGRGPATIHDVTVGTTPEPPKPEISPALSELYKRKNRVGKALERALKTREALEKYLSSLHVEHVKADELDKILDACDTTGSNLEENILSLQEQLSTISADIQKAQEESDGGKTAAKDRSSQLRTRVSLSLFAETEGDLELVLIYAVLCASWTPIYDVRVDMKASETPITLVYKATITQSTAEDWDDVPLILETATPTFQVGIPSLNTWTLSIQRPAAKKSAPNFLPTETVRRLKSAPIAFYAGPSQPSAMLPDDLMRFRTADITSKGNVSATFAVPGIITIPSDGLAHNVTVAELKLDATMSWVAVPKVDARTRLSAKIKNASDYTLLSGIGSIYVDGSFISKSTIPAVSPGESFDCALGLDPAIRITYHPVSRKTAQTGFYSKTNVNSYSQRTTVYNTKSITITNLRIVDQVPVSGDESINVKLITPPLPRVAPHPDDSVKDETKVGGSKSNLRVKVSQGVTSEWGDGLEDTAGAEDGVPAIGQDGKLSWLCEIPSQGKVNLLLQWEVTSPASSYVPGL